jgi:4-hydroxybenzoate polyprenyltransferase
MSQSFIGERLTQYFRLMRLDKPIGILLLLWPTLWAVWIAWDGHPPWVMIAIFVAGTVLMRSAGCVMNDMADTRFDAHVTRTRNRPLVTGAVSRREAIVLIAVLVLISFVLVLLLNTAAILLSIPALALAASYPFTKRFFALPQAYLGVAFGFGIPMAFAARYDGVPPIAWVMLAANIFWAIGYDTEYAMVDRDDDIKIGMRTAAITFGRFDVTAVMTCYVATLCLLYYVGGSLHFGAPYAIGLAVAGVMMAYHYTLIRTRSREGCFKAFLHNNWVGAAVFAGIVAEYLLRR